MIFRSSPKLSVLAPRTLVAGSDVEVEVELHADRVTKVKFVDVELIGRQGWSIGSGNSRISNELVGPRLYARLMGPGTLHEGKTRLPVRMKLPDMPPSHGIEPANAALELTVKVSMPWWTERHWWPDGRRRFDLPVRIRAPAKVERVPYACRSRTATDNSPRLEVAMASTRLVAGETVVGSCALFHVDDRKPREINLQFVPVLKLHGRGRGRDRRGVGYAATVSLPPGSSGTSIPFSVKLPNTVTPTFRATTHDLEWQLVASVPGSFFTAKIELAIPLDIVDASAAKHTPKLSAAPRLADERVAQVFSKFAATAPGWRVVDDEAAVGETVSRATDDGDVRIAYVYRGEAGTFVRTTVAGPSLGLGLEVEPGSTLRHVFVRDIEIGISAWDRAHVVKARSEAQTAPVLREIVAMFDRAKELGTLVRWTDTELVHERAIESIEGLAMLPIAAALARVDTAIRGGRALVRPPPELEADVHLESWRELAKRWHGRLTVGDLAVTGTHGSLPVTVGLRFDDDGVPTTIVATAGSADHASGAARELKLSTSTPALYGSELALRAKGESDAQVAVGELLAKWPLDIAELSIADGVATAARPLPADAARARELVEALCAVLAALAPDAGPYR